MRPLRLTAVARAAGAVYTGPDAAVADICTDTRNLTPGCLFVALRGENFDGHDYIAKALETGAAFALSQREGLTGERVLSVADTRRAYLGIAAYYRRLLGLSVVAVTGSVGKTTTKELTALVLQSRLNTGKTAANLNNEIGLSQTILALENEEAAVLELGIDGPGQMTPLAKCAAPEVGIVTNIGVSHLQSFNSREALAAEKLALRDAMPDSATLLLCGDDELLRGVTDRRLTLLRYGLNSAACDIYADNLHPVEGENGQTCFDIHWQGRVYPALLPALGAHTVRDALAAFGAGVALGIPPGEAAAALAAYVPAGMRQKVVKHGGVTVVEDCYNAAPDSMRAALDALARLYCPGNRIAVFSDMLELGNEEIAHHREIGKFAATRCDMLLCTGPLAAGYAAGAAQAGISAAHFPTQEALLAALLDTVKPGDALWFKASRGMKLERVIEGFYGQYYGTTITEAALPSRE